jgi:hypothetical protein
VTRVTSPLACVLIAAPILGCAAGVRTFEAVASPRPDCSFDTATTCWTLTGRFPARPMAADTAEDDLLAPPAATLAVHADTTARDR